MWFLLLVVGIFNLAAPKFVWYITEGWKFKDAEPSEESIVFGRIIGGICIVISIFMLFD